MRHLLTTILISLTTSVFCQRIDHIGQLKFVDCKIIGSETVLDTISGQPIKMIRLRIKAKTEIQVSCNYGDPSKNKYKKIKNEISVSYASDSIGSLADSIFAEIKHYVADQEAYAKRYNSSNDFSFLPFHKSFFLNDTIAIPYIRSNGESPDSFQLFYIDNQVYKIELLDQNSSGSLSSFVHQNMYFFKDNKPMELGEYLKNIDQIKIILARKNSM